MGDLKAWLGSNTYVPWRLIDGFVQYLKILAQTSKLFAAPSRK
jgi:hypothetical protein